MSPLREELVTNYVLEQCVCFVFCRNSGVEVRDFGASWRDGIAFLALIDAIKANLINLAELRKVSNRSRLETAFDVAETKLGIARLLDAEDVDVDKPDEKSIMTYVAQFLHKYPEPKVCHNPTHPSISMTMMCWHEIDILFSIIQITGKCTRWCDHNSGRILRANPMVAHENHAV